MGNAHADETARVNNQTKLDMTTQHSALLLGQILTVLDSRKFRNVYLRVGTRAHWQETVTLPDGTVWAFRWTSFRKNPNRHKAYVTAHGRPVPTETLRSMASRIRNGHITAA